MPLCNQTYKANLFPTDPPLTGPPPRTGGPRPLLLHPFEDEDPSRHLAFDQTTGAVTSVGGSPRGRATIETTGLDRTQLRASRREKAEAIEARLPSLIHDLTDAIARQARAEFHIGLRIIVRLGRPDVRHTALVRGMILKAFERLGMPYTWDELEAMC